jgi:hypothetical protein
VRLAGVERVVVWARASGSDVAAVVESGLDHVILRDARGRVSDHGVAEAVDAADDIAGRVQLDLDLAEPEGWANLRLEPPRPTRAAGRRGR